MPSQAAAERILDTASKLFYQKGIRATGVDSIAAESGMTKMTLYACYGSKEELVRVYLARRDQRWREWLKEAVERRAHREGGLGLGEGPTPVPRAVEREGSHILDGEWDHGRIRTATEGERMTGGIRQA